MKKFFTLPFICFLLTISAHTIQSSPNNPPSLWQVCINIFYGKPTPTDEQRDNIPVDATVEAYITQLHYDLNGSADTNRAFLIPEQDMNELEYFIRKNIYAYDLQNPDHAQQKLHGILIAHMGRTTERILNNLEKEGVYVTTTGRKKIVQSRRDAMDARLKQIPHVNGEALAQFFGTAHQETVAKLAKLPDYAARSTWNRYR